MNNDKKQTGLTLVELLVAMVVGMFLLAGVLQIYMSNFNANNMISGISSQQENARVAIQKISQSMRASGHFGGVESKDIQVMSSLALTGQGDCNQSWITDTSEAIRGFEGAATIGSVSDFPDDCITHYVPNSDVVVVRYASPDGWRAVAGVDAGKVYLRSSVTGGERGAEILAGGDISSTRIGLSGGSPVDGVGIYNYEYKVEVFYLRPCSEVISDKCDDEISTLVRLRLDGLTLTEEALALGVEQFKVEYGVDSDRDYVAEDYVKASEVSDWKQIISSKISVVIRSDHRDNQYRDTQTYQLASDFSYQPDSSVQNYRRKVYSKVIQHRNMNRG